MTSQEPNVDLSTTSIIEPNPPLPDYKPSDLPEALQKATQDLGWEDFLIVQKKAIPYILNANDLIVQSKTGSGKTGAFAMALLQIVEPSYDAPQALVMVPTRELAHQVYEEVQKLSVHTKVRSVAIYGGVGYQSQLDILEKGAHIVVGTPGRILDHIVKGTLNLEGIRDLVLDEADEMLSMGFYPDMKRIQGYLPKDRCSYMFSATMPKNVMRLAQEFLNKPKLINLCSSSSTTVTKMDRVYYKVEAMDKDKALLQIIETENPDSAIIFCNTKKDVHYINDYLAARGISVGAMSGDISQSARESVLKKIKSRTLRFLVATDVAARGIDIHNLSHVIMYDHPEDSEVYVHRSGRTARAGNTGVAISLVTELEEIKLQKTAQEYGITFIPKELRDLNGMQSLIRERASAYLEREYRGLKNEEKKKAKEMLPLLDEMMESKEAKQVLGMLVHRFYWSKFNRSHSEDIDKS
jgi:ATP-dependent RNA helicase DeaD